MPTMYVVLRLCQARNRFHTQDCEVVKVNFPAFFKSLILRCGQHGSFPYLSRTRKSTAPGPGVKHDLAMDCLHHPDSRSPTHGEYLEAHVSSPLDIMAFAQLSAAVHGFRITVEFVQPYRESYCEIFGPAGGEAKEVECAAHILLTDEQEFLLQEDDGTPLQCIW